MDGQILDSVTEWDTVPVGEGADGLADLVERDFTGAVTDGVAWLFFLNGRGVGVVDGSVDDFEDADLTARKAPDDSLPLLYAMMSGGAETRAKYYTEDTPLSSAHETLSDGGFTGFVELSENVLSGDYYVVYYGGRSLPVAFVGASRKLLSGDEAFDRADDEVGIYRVREASISVLDLPTPEADADDGVDDVDDVTLGTVDGDGDDADGSGARNAGVEENESEERDEPAFDATAALGGDDAEPATETERSVEAASTGDPDVGDAAEASDPEAAGDAVEEPAPEEEPSTPGDDGPTADENGGTTDETVETRHESQQDAGEAAVAESGDEREDGAGTTGDEESGDGVSERRRASERDADADAPEDGASVSEAESTGAAPASGADGEGTTEVTFGGATRAERDDETVFDEEAEWRETQVIPPLAPDEEESGLSATPDGTQNRPREKRQQDDESRGKTTPETATTRTLGDLRERLQRAEARRDEAESRVAALESERDELETERDRLAEERDRLESERDELEAEVRRLRERIEELEAAAERQSVAGEADDETVSMAAESALSGTSLFVRYGTKGEATLEKAHAGDAERDAVNENLRLEYHTTFESDPVTVDGQDFEAFLYDTIEYRFVRWLVEELLYELQATGNTGSMQDLYDVLPAIDRIEFRGNVSLQYEEDGQENREQRAFDVVFRDRMGNALVVAEINGSREATSESELDALVEGTSRLVETTETVAAAFSVTASFFDPAALEVASEATKSGLLGRSKGKSYVKLSRKLGFHLCLVETRHDDFHVNVPEL